MNKIHALGLTAALAGCATMVEKQTSPRIPDPFKTIGAALDELPTDQSYRRNCDDVRRKLALVLAEMKIDPKETTNCTLDGLQMIPCPLSFDAGDGTEVEVFIGDILTSTDKKVLGARDDDKMVRVSKTKTGEGFGEEDDRKLSRVSRTVLCRETKTPRPPQPKSGTLFCSIRGR